MKVNLISIIHLSSIPSIRFIVSRLAGFKNFQITISDIQLAEYTDYFHDFENVSTQPLAQYKSYQAYKNDDRNVKRSRYLSVIKKIFVAYLNNDKYLFIYEYQVLFFALILKRLLFFSKTKLIYHQYEMIILDEIYGIHLRFFKRALKHAYTIDLAIFPEQNRLDYFVEKSSIKAEKTMLIPNSCYLAEAEVSKHAVFDSIPADRLLIGHIGNIGLKGHFFEEYMKVIESLANDDSYFFLFVGIKSDELKERLKGLELKNALFLDAVPHHELASIYEQLDVGVILYRGVDLNFEYCAPNKLYEYWSHGIPVIAHQLEGLKSVYQIEEQGKLIDFTKGENLVSALKQAQQLKQGKAKLKQYFKTNLQIANYLDKFESRLKALD